MKQKVELHIYDLTNGMAKAFGKQMVGIDIEGVWHTGVVVFGREYYFGGGICDDLPNQTPYAKPVKVMDLGTTEIPQELFEEYLKDLRPKYTPESYDLFEKNCNNFSDEICQFLTGTGIPKDILDLPKKLLATPMGQMLKPFLTQMQGNIQNASHQHHFY